MAKPRLGIDLEDKFAGKDAYTHTQSIHPVLRKTWVDPLPETQVGLGLAVSLSWSLTPGVHQYLRLEQGLAHCQSSGKKAFALGCFSRCSWSIWYLDCNVKTWLSLSDCHILVHAVFRLLKATMHPSSNACSTTMTATCFTWMDPDTPSKCWSTLLIQVNHLYIDIHTSCGRQFVLVTRRPNLKFKWTWLEATFNDAAL